MQTIWKFKVEPSESFRVSMPRGATLLDVQAQGFGVKAEVFVWALVDSDAPEASRHLSVVGTGHDAGHIGEAEYVGTFQLGQGVLVFHLFDLGEA
jgi:hypothetical protein